MKGTDPLADDNTDPVSSNKLGDWYAHVKPLTYKGKSVVIFLNQKTLLSVFVPGYGNRKVLPEFLARTETLFRNLEIPEESIQQEMQEMQDICIQPTASRKTVGSLNRVSQDIRVHADVKYPTFDTVDWDQEAMVFTEKIHAPLYDSPMNLVYPKDLVREILELVEL